MAYRGVARRLVAALKFRGALVVADLMAAQMAANLPASLRASLDAGDAPVARREDGGAREARLALVPVPAAPARRRRRGFDPAHELSVALAGRMDRPLADCLVRRDRAGRQVGASRRDRKAPGRLVIAVRGAPPARAILVDDVHTTGATLDASARALTAAGTTVVAAITYARTL
jgi:predicted amidophosphoribosyltransferase